MDKYIIALNGISYPEWVKLKNGMDAVFSCKRSELEKELKLANTEDVKKAIHSQFGGK